MSNPRGSITQPIDIKSNQKSKKSLSAPEWVTQLHKVNNHKDIQSAPPADGKLESRRSESFYSQSTSIFVGSYDEELRKQRSKESLEFLESQSKKKDNDVIEKSDYLRFPF